MSPFFGKLVASFLVALLASPKVLAVQQRAIGQPGQNQHAKVRGSDKVFIDDNHGNVEGSGRSPPGDLDDTAQSSGVGPDDEDYTTTAGEASGDHEISTGSGEVVARIDQSSSTAASTPYWEVETKTTTTVTSTTSTSTTATTPTTTTTAPSSSTTTTTPAPTTPKRPEISIVTDSNIIVEVPPHQSSTPIVPTSSAFNVVPTDYPSSLVPKDRNRSHDPFLKPGILAAVIGGAVVGLLAAILLVMFIVYRMRKKDEGSYALDEPKAKKPTAAYPSYGYSKAPTREFYA